MIDRPIKLMVLDDAEGIVDSITRLFKYQGYQTFGAMTTEEAGEIIERESPDICIVDIYLVGSSKDGIEFVRDFRDKGSKKCIWILSSCMADDDKIRQASELGVYQYLVKPIRPDELKKVIAMAAEIVKKG